MKNGSLVIVEPGKDPRVVPHTGHVTLEDLRRHLGDVTVQRVSLGGGWELWCDDNGLLNDAKPNRKLPNGTTICGTFLLAEGVLDETEPLSDVDAVFLLRDIVRRWPKLDPDEPKPEPYWEVTKL